MIRLMFPPIVCQNAMWLNAGAWFSVALFKSDPIGWHIAWGSLALLSLALAYWMLTDMVRRGLVIL